MTNTRRQLGAEGEALAARHLEHEGFRVLARNVRSGGVELDLIAQRRRLLVFAEVKTRSTRRFGPPELAVDQSKQARIARGAAAWLHEHHPRASRIRFDVLCVERGGDGAWQVRHWPNAFDAP